MFIYLFETTFETNNKQDEQICFRIHHNLVHAN